MTDTAPTRTVPPVQDWTTDWDFMDPDWREDPYPIWSELRGQCPMAYTGRYNEGVWLPLTYDDLDHIAHDTAAFSSDHMGLAAGGVYERAQFPPINSDPPEHKAIRRIFLPFFAPARIDAWEPAIRAHCHQLATAIAERGSGDAAKDYAQHIPVHAIAAILGLPPEDGDQFRRWIHEFLELGSLDPEIRARATKEIRAYMAGQMADRRQNPGPDLISDLVVAEIDGRRLDDELVERMLILMLVAGIDTTWSSIGAALWHLATHDHDRRRLVAEPELTPTAVEELLRAYAPVNVVRRVAADTTVGDVEMHEGDTVLMTFPIACRDPEVFENADEVVIDRERNRHVAFGSGIHRCLGSNLARLEMVVAIETWLEHIPEYGIAPEGDVTWAGGQIRGPRSIPIVTG